MNKPLAEWTDEEIRVEMEQRRAERRRAANARRQMQAQALTREIIDALRPDHGRTSCSDDNPANGWGSNGEGSAPRCTRCALLETLEGRAMDEGFELRIAIDAEDVP